MIYSNCLLDTFYCAHVCGQNSVNPVAARSSDTHHLVTVGQRELAHIQILQLQWLNPLSQDLNTQASAEEATCCSGEKLTPSPVRAAPCCRAGRWLASGAGTHAHAHTHARTGESVPSGGAGGKVCAAGGRRIFFLWQKSQKNKCMRVLILWIPKKQEWSDFRDSFFFFSWQTFSVEHQSKYQDNVETTFHENVSYSDLMKQPSRFFYCICADWHNPERPVRATE